MKHALLAICLSATPVLGSAQTAGVAAAGYQLPTIINVAPGQVLTFYIHGIGASLKSRVAASSLPLPMSLAGISAVLVQSVPAVPMPILSVEPVSTCLDMGQPGCSPYTAVTVRIPSDIVANDVATLRGAPVAATWVRFSENGSVVATVDVVLYADQIHVLRACDTLFGGFPYIPCSTPLVVRADGSQVTSQAPAKPGDEIQIYAVGLGGTSGPDGDAVPSPRSVSILGISFDARPNALPSRPSATTVLSQPAFAGLIPGYVGLYQVNVTVPDHGPGTQPCNPYVRGPTRIDSNLTINIIGRNSFDGPAICVQPSSQ